MASAYLKSMFRTGIKVVTLENQWEYFKYRFFENLSDLILIFFLQTVRTKRGNKNASIEFSTFSYIGMMKYFPKEDTFITSVIKISCTSSYGYTLIVE